MSDLISIIIPMKNESRYIGPCLESILAQKKSPPLEIIVVDDQSTDDSVEIVKTYQAKFQDLSIHFNNGTGILDALQMGAQKAEGNFISRMDADDLMPTDKLALLYKKLLPHNSAAVATGKVSYFSTDKKLNEGFRQYEKWINQNLFSVNPYHGVYKECIIASANWLMKRSLFDALGGFETLEYPEDYDLIFKWYNANITILPVNRTTHLWRDHPNRASRNLTQYADSGFIALKSKRFVQIDHNNDKTLSLLGAGKKGKSIARYFNECGLDFSWHSNNPKKIGHSIYGRELRSEADLILNQKHQFVIAVSSPNELLELKQKFSNSGLIASQDYFFFFKPKLHYLRACWMEKNRKIGFILLIGLAITALQATYWTDNSIQFHYMTNNGDLPQGFNGLFAGSGECVECHGFDTAMVASFDLEVGDVNVVDDWSASMMANAAKDPFWRAKVAHEVSAYPQHQELIEDKCTSCHAPLGRFAAIHNGGLDYSIAELLTDSFGLDGVSCLACHQQSEVGLGASFSGELNFDTASVAYGQYPDPLVTPMQIASGYVPELGSHVSGSEFCAGCHTLITQTVDLEGDFTGDYFVEQATYHEWLNSSYSQDKTLQSCQSCHMPNLGESPIKLAAGQDTPPRTDFSIHRFAGANTLMLQLLSANSDTLGIESSPEAFDESIEATFELLQEYTASVSVVELDRTSDSVWFEVSVENYAGHKFPSGYPSRRAVVEFTVLTENEEALFHSGAYNPDFSTSFEDTPVEPHYQVISNEQQVQIYEMVMGDVNGDFTTILDEGYIPLKDNRLLPSGFSTTHFAYDTTQVFGAALLDSDYMNAGEKIVYAVATDGEEGVLNATVNLWYQSLPPRWMEEIFEVDHETINFFKEMYNSSDLSPVLIDSDATQSGVYVGIENVDFRPGLRMLCSQPIPNGLLHLGILEKGVLNIFDTNGRLCYTKSCDIGPVFINLPAKGMYFVALNTMSKVYILKCVSD